jgi:hypothetical protein
MAEADPGRTRETFRGQYEMKSQDAPETRLSLPQEAPQRTALSHPEACTLLFLGRRAFLVPQCDALQEDTPAVSLLSSDVQCQQKRQDRLIS